MCLNTDLSQGTEALYSEAQTLEKSLNLLTIGRAQEVKGKDGGGASEGASSPGCPGPNAALYTATTHPHSPGFQGFGWESVKEIHGPG